VIEVLEEEQAYKRLTQHHMREPTLAVLLCRNDPALAQAVGLAKYLSETPLIEVGTELQVCDLTTSMIADLKYMVCFKKRRLGRKGKRDAAKHHRVISAAILAVVAAVAAERQFPAPSLRLRTIGRRTQNVTTL